MDLAVIELDLYFMIIYLCIKYESNTSLFSKDTAQKPFHTEIKGHNSDNNRWILSIIELDLYLMIIYLCMKYGSNTPMYSKDIARKPFFIRTGRTYVWTRVMLHAPPPPPPPPIANSGGIKTIILIWCARKNTQCYYSKTCVKQPLSKRSKLVSRPIMA